MRASALIASLVFLVLGASAFADVATSSPQFLINLHLGSTQADVALLQRYLDMSGFAVAASGPGSLGNETDYFGRLTKNALIAFQDAHASDILIPQELSAGNGNFFSGTRAYVNSHPLLSEAPGAATTTNGFVLLRHNGVPHALAITLQQTPTMVPPQDSVYPTITFTNATTGTYSPVSVPAPILTVHAVSNSSGQGTYFLYSGNPALFAVDPNSGAVSALQSGAGGTIGIGYDQLAAGIYESAIASTTITVVPKFIFGGNAVGLAGTTTLQNVSSSTEDLNVLSNGSFHFSTIFSNEESYIISILSQPFNQTCSVDNAVGTVMGADPFVDLLCLTYPTFGSFSIPATTVSSSTFAINPPTTNSSGSFTYASSNTNVATTSAGMLTPIGAGTSTIFAIEGSDGTYATSSATTTVTVSGICEVANQCSYGGTCTDASSVMGGPVNSYSCSCPTGLTGQNCTVGVDECASNPCGQNGMCSRTSTLGGTNPPLNSYSCSCINNYTGNNCQTPPDLTIPGA